MAGATTLTSRIPQVQKDIQAAVMRVLKEAGADLAADAANRGHVITGSMVASVYVSAPDESNYEERAAEASSLNPQAVIVEEVKPRDEHEVVVGVAVGHGVIEDLGSVFRPPHPWFTPAVEAERQRFGDRFVGLVK